MVLDPLLDIKDLEKKKFAADANNDVAVRTLLTVEDIQIGKVEIKDSTSDTTAVVKSDGTNNALVVVQNTVPKTTVAISQTTTDNDVDATIVNANGASAVNIQDGGNSITVDASNLDVALSTRLKPADTLTKVTTVDTITNAVTVQQSTAGNLKVDLSGTAANTNKLLVTPDLPSGASTSANQNSPVTTVTPYNITCTVANTEYSQALPANTRALRFRCRTVDANGNSVVCRYAWVTGKVATPTAPYLTLPQNGDYRGTNLNLTSATLYLASATAGAVVEIEAWA